MDTTGMSMNADIGNRHECRANGLTYNRFIQGLKAAGVEVDRRVLSELATNEPATFKTLVDVARKSLISA